MEGLRARMGQITKSNLAMSTKLLLALIDFTESKIDQAENEEDLHLWVVFLTYMVISYTISLRGPEGFLLDLKGLNNYWDTSDKNFIITLLGRIKGERYDLTH